MSKVKVTRPHKFFFLKGSDKKLSFKFIRNGTHYTLQVRDASRRFGMAQTVITKRMHLWQQLLLDYGPDQAQEMMRTHNLVIHKAATSESMLLEISNKPFIHTEATVKKLVTHLVSYAKNHSQPYTEDLQKVVVHSFPIDFKDGENDSRCIVDICASWSAFSSSIALTGYLKMEEAVSGVELTHSNSTMYLPLINRWEENLKVGVHLMHIRYEQMVRSLLESASTRRATLKVCDDVLKAANMALKDQYGHEGLHAHVNAGRHVFDYTVHLEDVYDFTKLEPEFDEDEDDQVRDPTKVESKVLKEFAPSHVNVCGALKFLLRLQSLTSHTWHVGRIVNELLFSTRNAALVHHTDHKALKPE